MPFSWKNMRRGALVAAVILVVAVGAVLAQEQLAATDSGIRESQPATGVDGQPDGAVTLPEGAAPPSAGTDTGVYDTGRGDPLEGPAPDDNPASLAPSSTGRSPAAVSGTFSYYQVAGATLRGRSSTTAYDYDGSGCVHLTSGSGGDLILNTEAHIPDGALIQYIRLYYYDTSASGSVSAYLTRYTPGSATADLVSIGSGDTFAGGYGFVVSEQISETVNNANYAYTLIGWPSGANAGLRVCGIRVAYYAPLTAVAFLPAIAN